MLYLLRSSARKGKISRYLYISLSTNIFLVVDLLKTHLYIITIFHALLSRSDISSSPFLNSKIYFSITSFFHCSARIFSFMVFLFLCFVGDLDDPRSFWY